jgi:transglutaminase-like putative cysteine protease
MFYGARASFEYSLPAGIDGVRATLHRMVKIAREFLKPASWNQDAIDSLLYVRIFAQRAVHHCREKDYWNEIRALHRVARDQVRYVGDHLTAETLQYPDKTLKIGSGDCDDKALLLACLAHCIGYPTRFCAIEVRNEGTFSHVSPQILVGGDHGWTNAECIPIDDEGTKVELGWFPPDGTQVMKAHI